MAVCILKDLPSSKTLDGATTLTYTDSGRPKWVNGYTEHMKMFKADDSIDIKRMILIEYPNLRFLLHLRKNKLEPRGQHWILNVYKRESAERGYDMDTFKMYLNSQIPKMSLYFPLDVHFVDA